MGCIEFNVSVQIADDCGNGATSVISKWVQNLFCVTVAVASCKSNAATATQYEHFHLIAAKYSSCRYRTVWTDL